MFNFASPICFLMLLPLAAAGWFVFRQRTRNAIVFSAALYLPEKSGTLRTRLAKLVPILTLLGIFLAVIASARPRTILTRVEQTSNVIAIEMVVDVSGSMKALDLSIQTPAGLRKRTRLDAVKETFAEFIKQRPDDLIGLVTFGGYATTRTPLTTDHQAILHVLKGVEIPSTQIDKDGQIYNREEMMTAIGDGLATACARIEKAEPVSKIIILLSDGEANTGIIKPEQAVTIAKQLEIKVYTIGVGSRDGLAPVEGEDMFGRKRIVQAQYPLDEKTLKFISDSTDGKYFHVGDPEGLRNALDEIDKLEKTEVKRDVYEKYDELFPYYLFPGLILIIVGTGLNMLLTRRII